MGLADKVKGIETRKDHLLASLRPSFLSKLTPDVAASAPPAGTDSETCSSWLSTNKLHLNANQLMNVQQKWPAGDAIDLPSFVADLLDDHGGAEPVWFPVLGESPNDSHLALSGSMGMNFGEQYKPFPDHWGKPPNAQMKGHNGVVRTLPGGYGKGNAPMEKWVRNHLVHDKGTATNARGIGPFPYGNYSLGCTPNADHA